MCQNALKWLTIYTGNSFAENIRWVDNGLYPFSIRCSPRDITSILGINWIKVSHLADFPWLFLHNGIACCSLRQSASNYDWIIHTMDYSFHNKPKLQKIAILLNIQTVALEGRPFCISNLLKWFNASFFESMLPLSPAVTPDMNFTKSKNSPDGWQARSSAQRTPTTWWHRNRNWNLFQMRRHWEKTCKVKKKRHVTNNVNAQ